MFVDEIPDSVVKSNDRIQTKNGENQVHKKSKIERRAILKGVSAIGIGTFASTTAGAQSSTNDAGDFEIVETTVAEFQSAIKSGSISAEWIIKKYLKRIEVYDDELNSLITVNSDAVDRAQQLDTEYEESGLVGPLHGVPIVLKDNYDTSDMPTTAGSVALAESLPPEDAFVVRMCLPRGLNNRYSVSP